MNMSQLSFASIFKLLIVKQFGTHSNIGEFPDLNENDLSAADIAETTLKKLLDDVEKTSEHRQDQKKKKKKLLTEVERLKR